MWGKIIGSFAGFAMGGPIGALFGAAAGHAYDRMHEGMAGHLPPPWGERTWGAGFGTADRETARQMVFSVAVIVLGAKVAKVDGLVNRAEVNAFKEVFRVPPQETKNVGRIFDQAKQDAHGFEPYARQVSQLFRDNPAMLEDLLASLFYIARADGDLKPSELNFLRSIADIFNLNGTAFERVRAMFMRADSTDPYAVLGVRSSVADDEVKRIYRKLIRENHPDTLIAQGMPKAFVEVANRKMAAINAAYDQIERERGLK
jgi:DnaJ like chaperone protein